MLHILNGDALAQRLPAGLPGQRLVWREALMDGPTSAGLTANQWRRVRARHLRQAYGAPFAEGIALWRELEAGLEASLTQDEVVLWFEQDLYCMVNLLYLLAWYARQPERPPLSLVSGDLGRDADLVAMFSELRPVPDMWLAEAVDTWAAYCSDNPVGILTMSGTLPGLEAAIEAHRSRFPGPEGVSGLQRLVLQALADRPMAFGDLFQEVSRRAYTMGYGDLQFAGVLREMQRQAAPLIAARLPAVTRLRAPGALAGVRVRATDHGLAVAQGGVHQQRALDDRWLGGMRLVGTRTAERLMQQARQAP